MNNHTHTQYTDVFTWKPKAEENHIMLLLRTKYQYSIEKPQKKYSTP
jgi:hypothetical protein